MPLQKIKSKNHCIWYLDFTNKFRLGVHIICSDFAFIQKLSSRSQCTVWAFRLPVVCLTTNSNILLHFISFWGFDSHFSNNPAMLDHKLSDKNKLLTMTVTAEESSYLSIWGKYVTVIDIKLEWQLMLTIKL